MKQWKTKRVILETAPGALIAIAQGEDQAGDGETRQVVFEAGLHYYRQNGWLDRLVLNSPIDEPNGAEDFEEDPPVGHAGA